MRGIKDRMIEELSTGKLAWFFEEVKNNKALYLSIEENSVSIYYRGNSMVNIKPGGGFTFTLQEKYFTTDTLKEELAIFLRDKKAIPVYQRKFPVLTQAVDENFASLHQAKDEVKQSIACQNQAFFAMDYAVEGGCADLLGIFDGKIVLACYNSAEDVSTFSSTYEALNKALSNPAEKERLHGSVANILANFVALGLLPEVPTYDPEQVEFLAIVSGDTASVSLSGGCPVKTLTVAGDVTTIDYSQAQ